MKNFRSFTSYGDFSAVTTNLTEEDLPFIAYREDIDKTFIYDKQPTLEIAYWKNSAATNVTYTIPWTEWNDSVGYPVGIVVIPRDFLPDRKARIMSLNDVDFSGNVANNADIVSAYIPNIYSLDYPSNYDVIHITTKNSNFGDSIKDFNGFRFFSSSFSSTTKNPYNFQSYGQDIIYTCNSDYTFNSDILTISISGKSYYTVLNLYNGGELSQKYRDKCSSTSDKNYFDSALKYKINENDKFQWYLPSVTEFATAMALGKSLNNALSKLKASELINTKYFLSTYTKYSNKYIPLFGRLNHAGFIYEDKSSGRFRPFTLLD